MYRAADCNQDDFEGAMAAGSLADRLRDRSLGRAREMKAFGNGANKTVLGIITLCSIAVLSATACRAQEVKSSPPGDRTMLAG